MDWSNENTKKMQKLQDEGKTASQIAGILGTTTHAVESKVYRMNLAKRKASAAAARAEGGGAGSVGPETPARKEAGEAPKDSGAREEGERRTPERGEGAAASAPTVADNGMDSRVAALPDHAIKSILRMSGLRLDPSLAEAIYEIPGVTEKVRALPEHWKGRSRVRLAEFNDMLRSLNERLQFFLQRNDAGDKQTVRIIQLLLAKVQRGTWPEPWDIPQGMLPTGSSNPAAPR